MKHGLVVAMIAALFAAGVAGAQQQDPEAALRLFAEAERLTQEGDLEAALRNYELLVRQFAGAAIADDALLRTAEGHWQLGDRAAAEVAISALKNDYTGTAGAAGAFVLEGNIRRATSRGPADLEAAREAFRSVVLLYGAADFPSLEWRARARLRAGEASILLGEPQAAAAHLVAAIEDEPHSRWTEPAQLHLATVRMRSGAWQPAAEILQRIIDESALQAGSHATDDGIVATARRRLELSYRLQLRPSLSRLPWEGARRVRFTGPQLKDPVGIDAGEDNRVVIVDTGIPLVAVVEPDGTLSHRIASSDAKDGFHPWWGRGADPYVAAKRSVLNVVSRQQQNFSAPDNNEMKQVEEVTAGAHGIHRQWMVLDSNRKRVLLMDEDANHMSQLVGGDNSEPVDIAIDYRGRLYVLDRRAKTVLRFSADGGQRSRVLQGDWRRPEAIALDGLGNLYILDRDAKTIEVFDPNGLFRWRLGPQLPGGGIVLKSPRDISVDDQGRIYIADKDLKAFLVIE